ncbi:MAG: DapH/DapD/GlmU-related protein [Pseudobdellovibrionaceae bacterium]
MSAIEAVRPLYRKLVHLGDRLADRFYRIHLDLYGGVQIGERSAVSRKAVISFKNSAVDSSKPRVTIGKGCTIKDYAQLLPREGFITIGDKCSINPYCVLLGYGGITIGNHVRIATGTTIIAFNHNFEDPTQTIYEQGNRSSGITIEDDVWIASGVRILDGVTIGKGSIIGAGAVVTKSIPPFSVAVGVPAQVIKERKKAA